MMANRPASRPHRWYRGQGWGIRLHVAVRWVTGPFGRVEDLVGSAPRVLDWGCGHGIGSIRLALADPDRFVHGVDLDPGRVEAAAQAAEVAGVSDRAAFSVVGPGACPQGRWDAVVLNDVLYLMDPVDQERVVRGAAATLGPGGVLVAKELDRRPRWKAVLTGLQERWSVGRLALTPTAAGLQPFPSPEVVAGWMRAEGLTAAVVRLDRGYHAPHVAVVGRRDDAGGDGRLHP